MNRDQEQEHRIEARDDEADQLQAELDELQERRRSLQTTIRRLRAPVDVDGLALLAETGDELTQAELAILAAERPDVFNTTFERSIR